MGRRLGIRDWEVVGDEWLGVVGESAMDKGI
jgi:hypothetical protein